MAAGTGSVTIDGYTFDRAAYSLAAAAVMLGGVTRHHLSRLEKAGELRTIRLGGRVLVPAAEIARLVAIPQAVAADEDESAV